MARVYRPRHRLQFVLMVLCAFFQEVDKSKQAQDAVLRELRNKSEADREVHARDTERLEVSHRRCRCRCSFSLVVVLCSVFWS